MVLFESLFRKISARSGLCVSVSVRKLMMQKGEKHMEERSKCGER